LLVVRVFDECSDVGKGADIGRNGDHLNTLFKPFINRGPDKPIRLSSRREHDSSGASFDQIGRDRHSQPT
jgi:hypothetical protein